MLMKIRVVVFQVVILSSDVIWYCFRWPCCLHTADGTAQCSVAGFGITNVQPSGCYQMLVNSSPIIW